MLVTNLAEKDYAMEIQVDQSLTLIVAQKLSILSNPEWSMVEFWNVQTMSTQQFLFDWTIQIFWILFKMQFILQVLQVPEVGSFKI